MNAARPSTLADVAALAGVHASTVSRALSRPDLVARETRERVQAAALELDFTPNRAARNLVQGQTGAVGLLVPDIANPYFAAIVQAAQAEAAQHELVMLLADTLHDPEQEQRAIDALRTHVDALIICSPVIATHAPMRAPVVYVNRRSPGVQAITVDQVEIVRLALEHLALLGHRRIAWVNGPDSYWSCQQRSTALDGVVAGLTGLDITIIGDQEPTFDGGREASALVLDAGVTAAIAFNDLMALGVMAGVQATGRTVPDDLSIVGSDDVQAAAMSWPPLTTVASPLDELGRSAVRAVLAGADPDHPRNKVLQPTMVVRGSTRDVADG